MDGLILVKATDLTELLNEIKSVKQEIQLLRDREEELKAYSIQQAADLLNLHYNSVRKLVVRKKLFAKYLDGENGKCTIPAWAIREYLNKEKSKTNS